jgi:hypothetical protein
VAKPNPNVTILGPATGYTDLLDQALEAEIKAQFEGDRKFNPLRPSSAGKCANKISYELDEYRHGTKHPSKPYDARVQRIFDLGHAVEWATIKAFRKIKGFRVLYCQQVVHSFEIKRESEVSELLKGSLDWCMYSPEHKAVFDAKSRRDRGIVGEGTSRKGFKFKKVVMEWDLEVRYLKKLPSTTVISKTAIWIEDLQAFINDVGHGDPLAENLKQLNIYATSSFALTEGITHGVIYRYNKNSSAHFEIRFKPSLAVLEESKRKFNMISDAIDRKELPVNPDGFPEGSFACEFCSCPLAKQKDWSKSNQRERMLLGITDEET